MSDSVAGGSTSNAPQQDGTERPFPSEERGDTTSMTKEEQMKNLTSIYPFYDDRAVTLTPDTMRSLRMELRDLKASLVHWRRNRKARMEKEATEPCPFVVIDRKYQLPPKTARTFYVSYHNSGRLNSMLHKLREEKEGRMQRAETSGTDNRREFS